MSITPAAAPVHPLLASTLLPAPCTAGEEQQRPRLLTGYTDVDQGAFDGGLEYGQGGVVGVACGDADVAGEFACAALTTHLLAANRPDGPQSPTLHVAANPLDRDGAGRVASASVYYIDALAHPTFSPTRLNAQLISQLRRDRAAPRFMHTGYMYAAAPSAESRANSEASQMEQELRARADEAMERVALLRIFDFPGLLEAVGEVDVVITELKGQSKGGDTRTMAEDESAAVDRKPERSGESEREVKRRRLSESPVSGPRACRTSDEAAPIAVVKHLPAWRHRGEVIDSQASVDVDTGNRTPLTIDVAHGSASRLLHRDVDADADMLDAPSPSPAYVPRRSLPSVRASTNRLPAAQFPPLPADTPTAADTLTANESHILHVHASKQSQSPILLIVAALPRVLAPLMREDHVRGHALLAHLGRRLGHLTQRAPVCVMLLNTTVGVHRASGDDATVHKSASANVNANAALDTLESAFSDVSERPALGRTWPFFADVSVMLSRHRSEKVRREGDGRGDGEWIVEVLADRDGRRVGRWGVFDVVEA